MNSIDLSELDATDLRILDQLPRDASLSNQDLAAAIHTSPATCLRRVKRLVDSGVIERDRKSTRLNSSHPRLSRMPSSA